MFFKDDDTLSYMDTNKRFSKKQKTLRDPLNEDENSDTPFFEETQKKEPKPKKPSAFKKLIPYLKTLIGILSITQNSSLHRYFCSSRLLSLRLHCVKRPILSSENGDQ